MTTPQPLILVLQDGAAPGGAPDGAAPETNATLETNDGGPPTTKSTGSPFASLLPFLVIGVIFWVLLIGPERKNRKRQELMRKDLKKGDDVMTTGGMFGRVIAVDDEKVTLQIADGVRVKFVKQSIQGRIGDEVPQDAKKDDEEGEQES